jgi:hypothetical protein
MATGSGARRAGLIGGVALVLVFLLAAILFFRGAKPTQPQASQAALTNAAGMPPGVVADAHSPADPSPSLGAENNAGAAVGDAAVADSAAEIESASATDATSAAAFAQLEKQVLAAMPSASELKKLSEEEVHLTPEPIRRGGRELARISQALEHDSTLIPRGIEFFEACALRDTYVDVMRALCLAHARDYLRKQGRDLSAFPETEKIPAAIRKMADSI